MTIKFTGFKNPNYVNEANLRGALSVQVLGGSLERTEVRARTFSLFELDLSPY